MLNIINVNVISTVNMYLRTVFPWIILYRRGVQTNLPKEPNYMGNKIAQYKMYTKILAQGTKFVSGTTGLRGLSMIF